MTQEEKQLLLKDLCGRLPYNVKINIKDDYSQKMIDDVLCAYHIGGISYISYNLESRNLRPYLRSMSYLTKLGWLQLTEWEIQHPFTLFDSPLDAIDYFLENHLDYRGLIDKGLALEAPEGMYKQ